jgi:hypothetical protein
VESLKNLTSPIPLRKLKSKSKSKSPDRPTDSTPKASKIKKSSIGSPIKVANKSKD